MPNEWISVKEKVPENREWVLIIGEFTEGGFCVPHIAEFDSGVWRVDRYVGFDYEKLIGAKVTHWMPLPEPPEELQNPVITSKSMGETCTALGEKLSETVKTEQEVVRYYSYTPTGEIQKFMMKKIKDGWRVKVCLERESEVLVVYERMVGDV